jgi:hypothetical protein
MADANACGSKARVWAGIAVDVRCWTLLISFRGGGVEGEALGIEWSPIS